MVASDDDQPLKTAEVTHVDASIGAPLSFMALLRKSFNLHRYAIICQLIVFVVGLVVMVVGMTIDSNEPAPSINETAGAAVSAAIISGGVATWSQALAHLVVVLVFYPVLVFVITKYGPPSIRSAASHTRLGKSMPAPDAIPPA